MPSAGRGLADVLGDQPPHRQRRVDGVRWIIDGAFLVDAEGAKSSAGCLRMVSANGMCGPAAMNGDFELAQMVAQLPEPCLLRRTPETHGRSTIGEWLVQIPLNHSWRCSFPPTRPQSWQKSA